MLAALAHHIGMKSAAVSFATVGRGRDMIRPALEGKRLLIAVDNVSERTLIDAFRDLSPNCPVPWAGR